jgi:hypothetical protein
MANQTLPLPCIRDLFNIILTFPSATLYIATLCVCARARVEDGAKNSGPHPFNEGQ